jgi:hypothetical protein
MIDEISSDPEIWIAPYGEVAAYLNDFATDVGIPVTAAGVASAWLHGLSQTDTTHVVVTSYNAACEESGWSNEIALPPQVTPSPERPLASEVEGLPTPRALPNPMVAETTLEFVSPVAGPARVEIFSVSGRAARAFDLGWVPAGMQRLLWDGRDDSGRPVAAGIYWVRVHTGGGAQVGKVVLRR